MRVLGDFEVVHHGETVDVRGAKQRAILAVLALRRGETVPAERLVELVWGDDQPANPANALQAQVSALRKLLPEPALVTRGVGYALDLAPDDLDADRFEVGAAEGRRLRAAGQPAQASARLRQALALWRGAALADFAYDDFAQADIVRLEEARLGAVEARIDADLASGHHAEVVGELEALCAAHPLQEELWRLRMVALYRCGRQADALRVYADARATLVEELGIEPGPELRRTEALILAQDDELAPPAPAFDMRRDGNLRARLTRFFGRDAEVKEVAKLLRADRLVTLVGPGGAGKTRLAVEVADLIGDSFDGAWLVELAPVTDPCCVACAAASALGVDRETAGAGDDAAGMVSVERIARFLTGRSPLIVLDNCEHLVDAAAAMAEHLLGAVPGLRVLATSREGLGVPGEDIVAVDPLPLDPALDLFADRARAVDRRFALDAATRPLAVDICRRLDGLPLALELAAARLRAMPLHQIAARLDDRFRLLTGGARTALPRQQTLHAVVDWSYDLLADDERRLFARLSAFPGGCRTEAAEAVCADDDLPADTVVELIAHLVDKSLVVVDYDHDGEPRYRQLQTLWAYAQEKLAATTTEHDAVHERHAAWFRRVAEDAQEGLRGATGPECRRALEADLDNLRAAFDWYIARGDAPPTLSFAVGMAWLWFLRADYHEAVRWLQDALDAPGNGETAALRIRAGAWRAYFGAITEEPEVHLAALADASRRIAEHGRDEERGEVGLLYASTLNRVNRLTDTLEVLPATQEAMRDAGHEWGLAMADMLAAVACSRLGRIDDAETYGRAAIAGFKASGERVAVMEAMGAVAALHELRGDLRAALHDYERIIEDARDVDARGYLAFWNMWRAVVLTRLGDDAAAIAGFDEALDLHVQPVATAMARIGRARALARLGRAHAGLRADLAATDDGFLGLGRADGRAITLVADALTAIDLGDTAAAQARHAEVDALDPTMAALAGAALAPDRTTASALLAQWADHHLPVIPLSLTALLAPDHARLAARLSATAAAPQRVG